MIRPVPFRQALQPTKITCELTLKLSVWFVKLVTLADNERIRENFAVIFVALVMS